MGRRVVGALALAVFVVLLVLVCVRWGPLIRLDERIADDLNGVSAGDPALVRAMKVVSDVGAPTTFRVLAVLAAAWLWFRAAARRTAVYVLVTVLAGGLIPTAVKTLVNRPRPVVPHPVASAYAESFPSSHAFGVTVGVGVVLVLLHARLRGAAVGLVVVAAVCWSRLQLGVHYVSDVVAGVALGVAWLVVTGIVAGRRGALSRE